MPELRSWWPHAVVGEAAEPEKAEPPTSPLGGLVFRRAIYSRNDICWLSVRAWSHATRQSDMLAFRAAKAACDAALIDTAAGEVSDFLQILFGRLTGWTVTTVPVGHSRRPDSFAVQLATGVASRLDLPFLKVFADRFVSGVSHPKEFAKLPALNPVADIATPILLVDDVATSGWHLEEALAHLRTKGLPVLATAWISGNVK